MKTLFCFEDKLITKIEKKRIIYKLMEGELGIAFSTVLHGNFA